MTSITVTKCSECPFFRHLDENRGVCTDSATNSDVVRGHWEVGTDCVEKIEALEVEEAIAPAPTQTQIEAVEVLNAYEEVWGVGRIYTADEISEVVSVSELVTIAFSNGLTKTFAQTEYDYLLLANEVDYLAQFEERSEAQERGTGFLAALSYQETQAESDYNNLMYLERLWWEAIGEVEKSAPGSREESAAYREVDKAEKAIAKFTQSVNVPCLA